MTMDRFSILTEARSRNPKELTGRKLHKPWFRFDLRSLSDSRHAPYALTFYKSDIIGHDKIKQWKLSFLFRTAVHKTHLPLFKVSDFLFNHNHALFDGFRRLSRGFHLCLCAGRRHLSTATNRNGGTHVVEWVPWQMVHSLTNAEKTWPFSCEFKIYRGSERENLIAIKCVQLNASIYFGIKFVYSRVFMHIYSVDRLSVQWSLTTPRSPQHIPCRFFYHVFPALRVTFEHTLAELKPNISYLRDLLMNLMKCSDLLKVTLAGSIGRG